MIKSYMLTRDMITNKGLTSTVGVIFFVLAAALGAYVRIPVPASPVPITLQTFFVLMAGACLGKKLGAVSQLCYALLSVPFLPGPTGGYFIGFIVASYIVGFLLERDRHGIGWVILSFTVGNAVIYLFGALWLAYIFGLGPVRAFACGALPFIPGDIAKLLTAALVYSAVSTRSKKIFSL